MPLARLRSQAMVLAAHARRARLVTALVTLGVSACALLELATAPPASGTADVRTAGDRSSGYVLVYSGPVVCHGCAELVGDVVRAAGLPLRYVSRPEQVAGLLRSASAFVVPATDYGTESMRRSFAASALPALRSYLRAGGRYWGVCGGAFLAARLGIVPVRVETYSGNPRPHLEKVRWYGRLRWMFYEGGPRFIRTSPEAAIKVIATYSDGSIAAFAHRVGRGKVIVTGPHPEATRSWLIANGVSPSGWRPTFPLAVAMLRDLLA
jgi:hypothetical protein